MELHLPRRQLVLGAILLAAVLVVGSRVVLPAGTPQATLQEAIVTGASPGAGPADPPAAAALSAAPGASVVVVDVVGAVRRPGLYRLASGGRVAAAVAAAGGATRRADLDTLNLAAPLADGEQIVVPRKGAPGAGSAGAGAATSGAASSGGTAAPVQLSTATVEQLDALPGIGPVTAQKIVDYRAAHGPFRSVDDLESVPGIGPARVDQLRGLVVP